MVQGYYTLPEAAQVLGLSLDELKQMAQRSQIRSFQDRGTLRFRIADIQELQRQRLGSSDPELVLGDARAPKEPKSGTAPRSGAAPRSAATPKAAPPPKSDAGPRSGAAPRSGVQPKSGAAPRAGAAPGSDVRPGQTPKAAPRSGAVPGKTPKPAPDAGEVFDFDLEGGDKVDIGHEPGPDSGSPRGKKGSTPRGGRHKATGDSDVKLAADGSDSSRTRSAPGAPAADSDVQLEGFDSGHKPGSGARKGPPSSGVRKKGGKSGPSPADSGVRLVPMDNDSDVRIKGPGSDDVDLGDVPPLSSSDSDVRLEKRPGQDSNENMLLTEEINLDEEILKEEKARKPASKLQIPKPGELPPLEAPRSGVKKEHTDFELPPADSGEDFSLDLSDETLDLGAEAPSGTAPPSGINLGKPTDAGVSLEAEGDGSGDFELTVDAATPTPPARTPRPAKQESPGDSEFELTLEFDSATEEQAAKGTSEGSSEFELSLDDGKGSGDSSEFELTLDDSNVPAAKAKGEQDIFETDFEVPALEDSVETSTIDAGSSDFELALDDSDIATEDESGSQVVALEEEDQVDEGAETVAGEYGDVEVEEGEVEVDEEGEVREKVVVQEVVQERWIKPAPWGMMPTIVMVPCVIVMVLVGIMGFELVQSSAGFRSAGALTRFVADTFGHKMK